MKALGPIAPILDADHDFHESRRWLVVVGTWCDAFAKCCSLLSIVDAWVGPRLEDRSFAVAT